MVEYLVWDQGAGGSSPLTPTIKKHFQIKLQIYKINMVSVAQLVRASGCGSEGRGFEPRRSPHSLYIFLDFKHSMRL